MNERAFTEAIIDLAHWNGWTCHHSRVAYDRGKWRTPLAGDKGLPDLVLARGGKVILAELKVEGGKMTKAQAKWAEELGDHHRLWHPSDMAAIQAELRRE